MSGPGSAGNPEQPSDLLPEAGRDASGACGWALDGHESVEQLLASFREGACRVNTARLVVALGGVDAFSAIRARLVSQTRQFQAQLAEMHRIVKRHQAMEEEKAQQRREGGHQ